MRITDAKVAGRFRVFLRFDDGTSGTLDLGHLAGRGVFSAWLQEGLFERISVSPDGALRWPGDLDLCPDSLYLLMTGKTLGEVFPALRPALANA